MSNGSLKNCPICKSDDSVVVRDSALAIYRCVSCDHAFGLMPDARKEKYDEDYFLKTHKNYFENPDIKMFDLIYSEVLRFLGNGDMKLLDAGCGRGAFLRYVKSRRSDARLSGVDLIDNEGPAINFVKGDALTADLGSGFDVVCSLAVIEHIEKPAIFVGRLKDALKAGGVMAVMTIDENSFIFRLARFLNRLGVSRPYRRLYDTHNLQYFTVRSLKKLMISSDLEMLAHKKHNYSLKAVDVPADNAFAAAAYTLATGALFALSAPFKGQILQTIVCRKRG